MNKVDLSEACFAEIVAKANGYLDVTVKGDAGICAIMPLAFTHAIVADCNLFGYGDRWCYCSYEAAKEAFDAWDGTKGTEPTGWHRHPGTGRRFDPKTGKMEVYY